MVAEFGKDWYRQGYFTVGDAAQLLFWVIFAPVGVICWLIFEGGDWFSKHSGKIIWSKDD
jgi:hypothetical protein